MDCEHTEHGSIRVAVEPGKIGLCMDHGPISLVVALSPTAGAPAGFGIEQGSERRGSGSRGTEPMILWNWMCSHCDETGVGVPVSEDATRRQLMDVLYAAHQTVNPDCDRLHAGTGVVACRSAIQYRQ